MGAAVTCLGIDPDELYFACVDRLEALLICNPPFVRPAEKASLAAFDQASQHPHFGGKTDRGTPEQFLEWACRREHPSALPQAPLPEDLEAAIVHVWQVGEGIAADRDVRMCEVRRVAADLEPLTAMLCSMMTPAAVSISRAMALNIRQRSEPSASLHDIGDDRYCPHFGFWCGVLDALRWPHRTLVRSMVLGFRTVGDVPDSGVFRPVSRPASMSFPEFARTNAAWVTQCAHRVARRAAREPEMAEACWRRTIEERDAGLIQGPFTVAQLNASPGTGFPAFGYGRYRPLPRHAIFQGKKYRCIDDGACSGTNERGTSTWETILCDRPDSPLRIGLRFHELGPPPQSPRVTVCMGAGCDDKFAAYRSIATADEEYTVIMVHARRDLS